MFLASQTPRATPTC